MRRKTACGSCKQSSAHDNYDFRIKQCKCGAWNLSEIDMLIALKLKELGFNWYILADQIDEIGLKGTAKEQFLSDNSVLPVRSGYGCQEDIKPTWKCFDCGDVTWQSTEAEIDGRGCPHCSSQNIRMIK